MNWVLIIWIGYSGAHSVIKEVGPFSEKQCIQAGEKAKKELYYERTRIKYTCIKVNN